jgi:hypothetical protein
VTTASAQEPSPDQHHHAASASTWTWSADANAFFGYNYQSRHFADHSGWESQNWFGASGERPLGPGRLAIVGMLTLEPLTLAAEGSPQLFQTGESYRGVPLVHLQHPHDLVMNLGMKYRLVRPQLTYVIGADLVGSPTLGPVPFMHRESSRDNPQVPLMHHYLDATHSTPGVIRAGVQAGSLTLEASAFRGAGPDEDRLNIERPRLDSWAVRGVWSRGPWTLQMSGGHLRQPEWFEPFDATVLTASMMFDGRLGRWPLATTLAWGENRQFNGFNGNVDGYLWEWGLRATEASTMYGRVEVGAKELFGLGPHPKELVHRHWFSDVNAFTFGLVRDLPGRSITNRHVGRLGVGADVTLYRMSPDLLPYYASSRSFHVFLRWRPRPIGRHIH